MRIISVYNLKGGVGKSAAAVNLAGLAASSGERTLLWDLDPQAAATFYLRGREAPKASGKKIIRGRVPLSSLAQPTELGGLDLIPSGFSYRKMDILLQRVKKSKGKLRALLKSLHGTHHWVFLDCPPGITLLSENIFRASHILLIPLIPTTLSLRTYEEVAVFFEKKGLDRSKLLPFFSMVEKRKKLHREVMEVFRMREPGTCRSAIPFLSEIERMGLQQKAISVARPKSRGAQAYGDLWSEVKQRASRLMES